MKKKASFLPEFAGIALADILANSVAMIIILIVITISIKHQKEQEQLAEYEEVSVLLSRNIATSVVMNGLPTSALARLHDYENSPLDRNPRPEIMPIIELHKEFVRDYYTGKRFDRDTLLLQDNAFDRFLRTLSPQQHRRIRVDIYDIHLFYIAMSIIRKYGSLPSHWHFMDAWKGGDNDDTQLAQSREKTEDKEEDDKVRLPGESASDSDNENATRVWESFPGEVELDTPDTDEQYPFDDLAYDTEMSQTQDPNTSGQGAQKERQTDNSNRESKLSDQMFETLAKMMSGEPGKERSRGGLPNIVQFRNASPSSQRSLQEKLQQMLEMQGRPGNRPEVSYLNLMFSLFNFMERADRAAQAGDYSVLQRFHFQRDIVVPALTTPPPTDPVTLAFFADLVKGLLAMPEEPKALIVEQNIAPDFIDNGLKLAPNKPLKTASFLATPEQTELVFLPGEAEVQMRLGLFPAIYKGLSTPINRSHILMIPLDTIAPGTDRWRVASLSSPKRGDYVLAFVYGHFAADGEFIIRSDENDVQLNQLHTYTFHPPVPFRKEKESFLIFGAVALILLFGIMRRFRRVA